LACEPNGAARWPTALEQLLGPLDGQDLGDVHFLAAAVVALARVALGVLVGQDRSLGLQHGARDDVLGRDQLDLPLLPRQLPGHDLRDGGSAALRSAEKKPSEVSLEGFAEAGAVAVKTRLLGTAAGMALFTPMAGAINHRRTTIAMEPTAARVVSPLWGPSIAS